MSETENKYSLRQTNRFKKHLKLMAKRNKSSIRKIAETVDLLQRGEKLPERFRDHELAGNLKGSRECHILPDLLLIYRIFNDILILELVDTGSHADLFGM
ncbi:MAG: type II toxin-antitoxin system YafQ family toxin [Treponema succinifaciens]|uniref:type II toxin-antitoxin system YafQ family toxin n=1 Tax=Treponema succinifaciens TaxID=167 RepID=UPI0023F0D084|nr:type II toxin-antitoxin system YafQ family toxin [Treponema succinifaciens]MDD6962262.1 type II toxin-antitoxin system YafQ family toxin [Treponema succinifaciens]MDY5117125.1 type II toxin-antitoxin system YafQ family toxin [Treponema succinifaciens]